MARVEASTALLREFEDRELERKLQDPALRAEARGTCEKVIDLFALALGNDSKTPQDCWNRFVNALRAGDSEKASGYLTAGARTRYQKVWDKLGPDGVRKLGADIGDLTMLSEIGENLVTGVLAFKGPAGKLEGSSVTFVWDRRVGSWFLDQI